MASDRTRRLIVAATLANSIIAGSFIDRWLVGMPAWQRTGPLAWAAYSWHADLAIRAAIPYPGAAFSSVILSTAAAVSSLRDGPEPRRADLPILTAAALNRFQFWRGIRGLFQVLAFVANVRSLAALPGAARGSRRYPMVRLVQERRFPAWRSRLRHSGRRSNQRRPRLAWRGTS